jgi:hypothetical protein
MANIRTLAIVVTLLAGVAAAIVLLTVRPWEHRNTTAGPRTSISQGGACLQPALVPAFQPSLGADDCVTSLGSLPNGDVAVGTKAGLLGFVHAGSIRTVRPPGASGPVTDVDGGRDLLAFVVDQGIGLFALGSNQLVALSDEFAAGAGDGGGRFISAQYYIDLPGPGRPSFSPQVGYVKDTDSGVHQRLGFGIGVDGDFCVLYMPDPGAVPERWCTPPGILFPAPEVTLAPRQPGGCAQRTPSTAEQIHALSMTVTNDGYQPQEVTVTAGEVYQLTIDNQDAGRTHQWIVEGVRDSTGLPICTAPIPPGSSGSVTFAISQPGAYNFHDSLLLRFSGQITVQ